MKISSLSKTSETFLYNNSTTKNENGCHCFNQTTIGNWWEWSSTGITLLNELKVMKVVVILLVNSSDYLRFGL